ncbi:unnamed protein product [Urochloa humidicola]
MGSGDGSGPRSRTYGVTISCDGHGTCIDKFFPMPTPPPPPLRQHGPHAPPAVRDAGSYAVAGKLLLATAGAFAGVLLAIVALQLYNASRRRSRLAAAAAGGGGGRRQRRLLRSLAIGVGDDGDGGSAPSPRGLDPAVLAAIPVVVVLGAGGEVGDCAVCLAELEPGEKARALPRCGHRFHAECIDAWFRGNATCPLCRADVIVAAAAAAAVPSAPAEDGAAPPEVRIDVPGDDAAAPNASVAAPPAMARLPSATTDRGKAREVFASARFAASF